jgi:hypothetical protein
MRQLIVLTAYIWDAGYTYPFYLYDNSFSNLIFSFAPVVICGVKLNTEEEFEEPVSERIRKVDKITGTVTVIIAGGKQ